MTKPFHKDELVARIHAIVRRSQGHAQSVVQTGDLVVNLDAKTVEVDGVRVHLTGKEYQMLELLSLRKGTTLTKEMFLNQLYGGMDEPEIKIIDVFICKLRRRSLRTLGGKDYIETVWGRGYVLRDPSEDQAKISALNFENHASRGCGEAALRPNDSTCPKSGERGPPALCGRNLKQRGFAYRLLPNAPHDNPTPVKTIARDSYGGWEAEYNSRTRYVNRVHAHLEARCLILVQSGAVIIRFRAAGSRRARSDRPSPILLVFFQHSLRKDEFSLPPFVFLRNGRGEEQIGGSPRIDCPVRAYGRS